MRKRNRVRPLSLLMLLLFLAALLYLALAAVFHLPTVWLLYALVPLIVINLALSIVDARRARRRRRPDSGPVRPDRRAS